MPLPFSIIRSRRLAWVASCLSLALASLPGIGSLMRGRVGGYDANLAVLTATLISLVWYTQFTFETLQHYREISEQERARSREILATGLLAELEWVEGLLEQVRKYGPYSHYDPLQHPLLEQVVTKADYFSRETVSQLSRFHALLRDVRAAVNAWRDNPDIFGEKDSPAYFQARRNFRQIAEAKAHFALVALPDLVSALVAERGSLPVRQAYSPIEGGALPPLPPSPFGDRRHS